MIKRILFILALFSSFSLHSQNVEINYYSTGAGRNITPSFSKGFGNSEFGIGLGFNIGSIKQPDDQDNIYYKRLYPTEPLHYLNLDACYSYFFYNNWKCIQPFIFYDLQIKYSTTRTSMYIIHDYDSTLSGNTHEEKFLYLNFIEYFGPFLWIENAIGMGFKVDITEAFYLQQKLGFGVHLLFGEDKRLPGPNPEWEFYGLFNFGLGLRLNKP